MGIFSRFDFKNGGLVKVQIIFAVMGAVIYGVKCGSLIAVTIEGLATYYLAASTIPIGLAIILCSFHPENLQDISGLRSGLSLYLCLAAIILIIMALRVFI